MASPRGSWGGRGGDRRPLRHCRLRPQPPRHLHLHAVKGSYPDDHTIPKGTMVGRDPCTPLPGVVVLQDNPHTMT
jgi:hypothetical protein